MDSIPLSTTRTFHDRGDEIPLESRDKLATAETSEDKVGIIDLQAKTRISPNIDHGYAWVILAASSFSHAIFGFLLHSFSTFYSEIAEYFQVGLAETGWIGSICGATNGMFGLCLSILVTKFGCKHSCMVGGVGMCVGLSLAYFMLGIPYLYLTYGLLTGFFSGLMLLPSIVIVQHYFLKKRAIANGVIMACVNIGGLCSGPILRRLIDAFGLRGALLLEAGIVLHSVIFGSLFRNYPVESNQQHSEEETQNALNIPDKSTKKKRCNTSHCNLDIFKNKSFSLYMFAIFVQTFGISTFHLHVINYALFIDISPEKAAVLLVIMNVGMAVSAVSFGAIASLPRYNRMLQMMCTDVAGGVAVLALLLVHSFPTMAIVVSIKGITGGSIFSIQTTNLFDLVPIEKIHTAQAMLMMMFSLSTLMGVPFAGWLVDVTGSYGLAICFSGVAQILAAFLYMAIIIWQRKKQHY